MTKYLFCIILCTSTSLFAQKSPIVIGNSGNDFSDINSHLSQEPVQEAEKGKLQDLGILPINESKIQLFWGKVGFHNTTLRDQEYVLRVSRDFGAKRVLVYTVVDDKLIDTYETSDFLSDLPKDIEFQHDLYVSIYLPRNAVTWVYLKNYPLDGYEPFFDLKLWATGDWQEEITRGLTFQSMFHGVLWVLIIFSSALFIHTKDRTFLYYSLYMLSFSGFSAIVFNQVGLLIDLPKRAFFFLFFNQLFYVSYLSFLKHFISLSMLSPRWNMVINNVIIGLTVIGAIGCVWAWIAPDSFVLVDIISRITIVFSMTVIISVAVLSIVKSSSLMRYVGFGTLAMVIGMLISTAYVVLFDDQTTVYAQLGILIEALIFSTGLGYRMRTAEVQQRAIQEQLISQLKENEELQRSMNYELEKMVAESTEEVVSQKREIELKARLLEDKNASLNKASAFKDRLFAIIGHDLRSPIKSLKGVLDMHTRGQLHERELELFISRIHKSLNRVISLLDNVLMWALQQMDHIDYQPTRISIRLLVQDNIELLAPLAIEKQIDLLNLVDAQLEAFADAEMIKLVIRNILSNAIKFSNRGEEIVIKGNQEPDTILLHVSDKGMGIPKDNIDKLFDDVVYTTYGTAHEKGTGLGLSLCNEFIRKNNGFIYVESELGKGTTFTIELPTKNLRLSA